MKIGIDLDNTIISYDDAFLNVAKRRGWGSPAENPKNIIRMDSELA